MDRTVEIIGVPTDFGANRRGVDMGPSAIRYAGLADELAAAGVTVIDGGDIDVPLVDRWTETDGSSSIEFGPTETVCRRVNDRVHQAVSADRIPLVLGGDHSIAIGSLTGLAQHQDVGVLWLDAHADFNSPETTPSGNVHGMSLAAVSDQGSFSAIEWTDAPGVSADRIALIGLRDVDAGERDLLQASPVTAYTMSEIDRDGIATVSEAALDRVTDGVDVLHVSLDLDFLDPLTAPGVGTPVRGGVSYREAHHTLEQVAQRVANTSITLSVDLVEVNPIQDQANETAALATELAASVLGRRVMPPPQER